MTIGLLFCLLAFDGECIGLYTLSRYFSAFFNEIHLLIKKKKKKIFCNGHTITCLFFFLIGKDRHVYNNKKKYTRVHKMYTKST